ncbi:hypothetical protein B0H66DRAFT_529023 [Apodospora peruviana]|uniref:Uncharacterized protein n=1 Tax=Apodospora peruviana TaxID=516989 RepID=A0AAE0IH07_9PEZI|nr:hypothetical protein B0H66DRAFT_529023 [Apodospora peruviana]
MDDTSKWDPLLGTELEHMAGSRPQGGAMADALRITYTYAEAADCIEHKRRARNLLEPPILTKTVWGMLLADWAEKNTGLDFRGYDKEAFEHYCSLVKEWVRLFTRPTQPAVDSKEPRLKTRGCLVRLKGPPSTPRSFGLEEIRIRNGTDDSDNAATICMAATTDDRRFVARNAPLGCAKSPPLHGGSEEGAAL